MSPGEKPILGGVLLAMLADENLGETVSPFSWEVLNYESLFFSSVYNCEHKNLARGCS